MSGTGKPRTGAGTGGRHTRTGDRSGRSRPVADIVPQVGRAAFHRFGFVQSAVVSRWREIVGERYADASVPDSIRFPQGKRGEGTLTLTVESALAPMLQQVTPEIIDRVNRFFGYRAVARVALKHGEVRSRRRSPPSPMPAADVPSEMTSSLRTIADDGLRACLESLARQVCATSGPPVFDVVPARRQYPAGSAARTTSDPDGYGPNSH